MFFQELRVLLSLRETLALPCGQIARQRAIYARQRQRPHGEGLPGKGFFAVRLHQNARQSLCRAASSLPSATTRRRAVDVACAACICRAWGFAVRHPAARTAKTSSLPCAIPPHARQRQSRCRAPPFTRTAKSQPGTPQASRNPAFAVRMRTAKLPNGSLPCAHARQRP